MSYRYVCMNEDCPNYLETVLGEFKVGERVREKATGRLGTIQAFPCNHCSQDLELEKGQ
jgi:hypothetical protein